MQWQDPAVPTPVQGSWLPPPNCRIPKELQVSGWKADEAAAAFDVSTLKCSPMCSRRWDTYMCMYVCVYTYVHIYIYIHTFIWASLMAQMVKNPPAMPMCEAWVGKIPWRREWQPTQVFMPKEFHGQRNLAGYSPSGCKNLNTTELLSLSHMYTHIYCTL